MKESGQANGVYIFGDLGPSGCKKSAANGDKAGMSSVMDVAVECARERTRKVDGLTRLDLRRRCESRQPSRLVKSGELPLIY